MGSSPASGLFYSFLLSISLTFITPICAYAEASSTLELSQWSPGDSSKYGATEIENLTWYHFNSDYASTFYFYGGKNWLSESHQGEPDYFVDDIRLSLVRKGTYPVRFALYFPTSTDSKTETRRFAVSIQPSMTLKTTDMKLALRLEFLYYNTSESSHDITEKNGDQFEILHKVYGLSPKAEFNWDISDDWSFEAKGAFKMRWDAEGSPYIDYELTIGPSYNWDKTTSIFLQHFSADNVYTDNPFLSNNVSYYGLGLSFEI